MMSAAPEVDRLEVAPYRLPTDQPESDGTLEWDSTTIVVVHAHGGGHTGVGYTYASPAAAEVVRNDLAPVVVGRPVMPVRAAWRAQVDAVRNLGWPGLVSCAISAVDVALWDLAARCQDQPLGALLGRIHDEVPAYGSGGFCSYELHTLAAQLDGWASAGMRRAKIKVGRRPNRDAHRIRAALDALDGRATLMVDANGAYQRKEALGWAERFAADGIDWFEEPVSSDDLEGLRLLRDRGPGGLDVTAGEYGYHLPYFHHMLDAGAVDCLQADVTRCGGFTGFAEVAALCDARSLEISAHGAPQLAMHACVAAWHVRHVEWFHDHVRLEGQFFDGVIEPLDGVLRPDPDRIGLGLHLRCADAEPHRI